MSAPLGVLLAVLAAGPRSVSGIVYDDLNGNGRRDVGEKGLAGVAVSDGTELVTTATDGGYTLAATGRNVFVITPGDRRPVGPWYRPTAASLDFALTSSAPGEAWCFAQLSDPHVHPGNRERLERALGLAQDRHADFAVVTGDLNKDALRVDEATARGRLELYAAEVGKAALPVRSVPGNHDVFGIERHLSLVPATNPAYGKALYEEILGPRFYAFSRGRVHFVMLDTIGVDDLWYYGFLEAEELAFLRKELALVPAGSTVVTAGHIPLRTGAFSDAFETEGPSRTLLTVEGRTFYRHIVRNLSELASILKPYRWTLALQGHTHEGERLQLLDGGGTRYHTAPAVDATPGQPFPSGIVLYSVRGEEIDDGLTLPLGNND